MGEGDDFNSRAWTLGFGSALMIVSGYYGELVITGDLTPRWVCWFASMAFFLYIVYELLVGLSAATASEADPAVAGKIKTAQVMTVISWCTYPVVYCSPCSEFKQHMRLSPFSWATAPPTSSPSAVSDWSSTKSPTPNRRRRVSWREATNPISFSFATCNT